MDKDKDFENNNVPYLIDNDDEDIILPLLQDSPDKNQNDEIGSKTNNSELEELKKEIEKLKRKEKTLKKKIDEKFDKSDVNKLAGAYLLTMLLLLCNVAWFMFICIIIIQMILFRIKKKNGLIYTIIVVFGIIDLVALIATMGYLT